MEPSFRRIVRANRLISEGKCPHCETDHKPQIAALQARIEEMDGQLEAKDGYKLYVWQRRHEFIAMAHAQSVAEARQAIWDEDGTIDDSVPLRKEMHLMVREQMPVIFRKETAYAIITDSAALEESDIYSEKQEKRIKELTNEVDDARKYAEVEQTSRKYWSVRAAELENSLRIANGALEVKEQLNETLRNSEAEAKRIANDAMDRADRLMTENNALQQEILRLGGAK